MSYSTTVTSAAIHNAGITIAFVSSATSTVTKAVGKSLLQVVDRQGNKPVYPANSGEAYLNGVTDVYGGTTTDLIAYQPARNFVLAGYTIDILGLGASLLKVSPAGSDKHSNRHPQLTHYSRKVTSYDYETGAAEGVTVTADTFSRDDAVSAREFVFIPAGGKLPAQAAGDNKYYTYSRPY